MYCVVHGGYPGDRCEVNMVGKKEKAFRDIQEVDRACGQVTSEQKGVKQVWRKTNNTSILR